MSRIQKTYTLGPIKQLVDLNGDTTNFDLTFSVTSKDGAEFYAVVVDQTTLDNDPNPEYKKAPGTISGNIVADKGIYQNYFLLLKSEKPCECEVVIELKEIPKRAQPVQQPRKQVQQTPPPPIVVSPKKKSINWKLILLVLAVGGGLLYFFYIKKKKEVNFLPKKLVFPEANVLSTPPVSSSIKSTPVKNTMDFGGRRANENLIAKLNSLPLHK